MVCKRAYFIDADSVFKHGGSYVRLLVKGKKAARLYYRCDPYFYVDAPPERSGDIAKVIARMKGGSGEIATPLHVEPCEKIIFGNAKKILKVYCKKPQHVPVLKEAMPYKCYEYNIPFFKRFMIDFRIIPFSVLTYERTGREIKRIISIKTTERELPELKKLSFDIETYNPQGAPRGKKDPIIMISYSDGESSEVLTYKKCGKKFVRELDGEREIIKEFDSVVRKSDPDILYGYNSSNFDIPYLKSRSEIQKIDFNPGRGRKAPMQIKKGMLTGLRVDGRVHIDLYPSVRFFGFIGAIKAQHFTLDAISEEVLGKKKKTLKRLGIWEIWDSGDIDELAEYSLNDAKITWELGEILLPLQMELAAITKNTLFDVSLSSSGQLVESLLMYNAYERNEVIPNRPSDSAVRERTANPIKGAFVKLPEPGIYENIAVLDFRGLYPSIIISYNIDPFTITEDKTEDACVSPTGARFSKRPTGLIPSTLDYLLEFRSKIKQHLKKTNPNSKDYTHLLARSQALKILSNSFYGYLLYARSRWYNRECGESVTAWGRQHIHTVIAEAEKADFTVLYGDTDSVMVLYKNKKDVLSFLDKINKSLPEKMELELEGFYSRGVFVSKKAIGRAAREEDKDIGAKKKYALLGEDGRIKIRGFELVRRDWSQIAKDTQLKVLETILKEGSKEKAVKIVREVIGQLKAGKVSLEELAISTQLNKSPKSYEITSPELSAAIKAIKRGVPLEQGSMVSYVITKSGKTISDKAELLEFARDYDADYYINNQVLPSVMKILKELGYEEHDLKFGGKQKSLDSFFG